MLFNMVLPGAAGSAEEPFAFTYSGDFTDSRVDGKGDVTLNTSGDFIVTEGTRKVSVYILGAGGGGAQIATVLARSGGGGGNQTITVELIPDTYEIIIGSGGEGAYATRYSTSTTLEGGDGGNTSAFGATSTGGTGGRARMSGTSVVGSGGTPNGNPGDVGLTSGGAPNGGASNGDSAADNNGGDGLVRITFS